MSDAASQLRFAHLGVAVADLEKAAADYRDLLGYHVISGPFQDPIQKVSVCFLASDDARQPVVELIAPLGANSPVRRLLDAGGGAYHICFDVENIDAAIATMRGKGCLILQAPVPAVAFNNRRIAWLYTPSRQLIEVVEREG